MTAWLGVRQQLCYLCSKLLLLFFHRRLQAAAGVSEYRWVRWVSSYCRIFIAPEHATWRSKSGGVWVSGDRPIPVTKLPPRPGQSEAIWQWERQMPYSSYCVFDLYHASGIENRTRKFVGCLFIQFNFDILYSTAKGSRAERWTLNAER